MVKKITMM